MTTTSLDIKIISPPPRRDVGERIGRGTNHYGLIFGPANVKIHEVATALELDDADEAIRRSEGFVPSPALPAERSSHHHIDLVWPRPGVVRSWVMSKVGSSRLMFLTAIWRTLAETQRLVPALARLPGWVKTARVPHPPHPGISNHLTELSPEMVVRYQPDVRRAAHQRVLRRRTGNSSTR